MPLSLANPGILFLYFSHPLCYDSKKEQPIISHFPNEVTV